MLLKVLTLNIHRAVNWRGKFDLKGLTDFIKEERPDLAGLQEVERYSSFTSRFRDIPAELAKGLGMFGSFSAALKRKNRYFGNLILSKYPIIQGWSCPLPGSLEPRSFAFAQLLINGTRLNFLTTHLGLSSSDRFQQVTRILEFISQISGPLVITGDFNGGAEDPAVKVLKQKFLDLQELTDLKEEGTFRCKDGEIGPKMDYILTTPEFELSKFQIINNHISDHLPVMAEISLEIDFLNIAGEPVKVQPVRL